ncbi:succinate dehydrogenase, hydrophobic membrane anchor protein [Bartonella tamiae]|uniref:Succinate dehydrogenase hydrophobic membrane anchor subunit n=1 Tax=Bartonella tamiae Th239 TaxID=1094558 RepID=J1K331_9HYPH|nr:succinate dehydrogenase, hydrophobic membrane anchor protein [Bartonella tamiae]EJF91510.1 succinate dehydrogenase, hydrophobic membrane anchor protein [Bartonella tamiae Th239]EJF92506.1 succinate dehydrogenase, hydrophobic membrane anchor protein [Bartonella tamiae Th307]
MKKDFRTELGKVRGLGSAHEGTHHFWMQRLTAFANVPLFIFFIILVVSLVGKDYATVYATLSNPVIAAIMGLMVLSGIYHMKLGMQVIIEDYIHHEGLRIFVLTLNIFFCYVMGGALLLALLKITLGG